MFCPGVYLMPLDEDQYLLGNLFHDYTDKTRALNVVAVDSGALTLTVKYGGAYSGLYQVRVNSFWNGPINSDITFEAII